MLTPFPTGTDVSETINSKEHSRALLKDPTGADAMGAVSSSPAANTLLGRLKALADLLTAIGNNTDQLEGYLDTVEALLGTNNTATALTTAADDGFAITPGASILAMIPKALLVTATGTLSLGGVSNTPISFGTVQPGQIIPFRARYVYSSGTSATVIGLI